MNVDIKKLVAEGPQDLISDAERKERLDSVLFAQANLELEGETISPLLIRESARFVNGDITLDELQKFSVDDELEKRRQFATFAKANVELEGLFLTDEDNRDLESLVQGETTTDELREKYLREHQQEVGK